MNVNQVYINKLETLGGFKPHILLKNNEINKSAVIRMSQLDEVQTMFKKQIPQEYLDFVTAFGAISFIDSVNCITKESIPVSSISGQIDADNFYDFSDTQASILSTLNDYKGNLPDFVLPICDGLPGDLIVLNLSDENYGEVYYWYHEGESKQLYMLANSFQEFINGLISVPDNENEVSAEEVKVTKVSNKFLDRLRKSGKL